MTAYAATIVMVIHNALANAGFSFCHSGADFYHDAARLMAGNLGR